jgi:hypothetical protein
MTPSLHRGCFGLAALIWIGTAAAQTPPPDPEVARLRTEFEYGNYEDVLKRASERIDRGNLSEADALELHKYAGLAAFYLHQKGEAERHLWALLQINPDYSLDPFVVPPQAIAYLEALRASRSQQLDAIRRERRQNAERTKEVQEREAARVESEQQRRRLEELARRASTTQVRTQSFAVNLLPFGLGQFQQGRTKAGVIFAVTEGVLALTSILAFLAYNALIEERAVVLDERLVPGGVYTFNDRGIPPEREHQAIVWRNVKYISGGAFWLTYAVGVADAIIHHRSEVVTTSSVDAPVSEPTFDDGGKGARLGLSF